MKPDKTAVGRKLLEALEAAVAERNLPWQHRFRQGYVSFQRPGGYNVMFIDVYWARTPRLAVKLPASPLELDLTSPYPELQESWDPNERDWGWTIPTPEEVPDVGVAIEMTARYQPPTGPMRWTPPAGGLSVDGTQSS